MKQKMEETGTKGNEEGRNKIRNGQKKGIKVWIQRNCVNKSWGLK